MISDNNSCDMLDCGAVLPTFQLKKTSQKG